jgi:hypothetical protein
MGDANIETLVSGTTLCMPVPRAQLFRTSSD